MKNIQHNTIVNPDKVLMPPLHIKLGLIKNFVKAITKHHLNCFEFLCKKFPKLSQAKLKKGNFVAPQIQEVFVDLEFEKTLKCNYGFGIYLNRFARIFRNFQVTFISRRCCRVACGIERD